jgi:hypothetical protein
MNRNRPSGNIDSFGTFLRKLNTAHGERGAPEGRAGASRAAGAGGGEGHAIRQLVGVLRAHGSLPVPELMSDCGLSFSEFSRTLSAAADNEMVRLVNDGPEEVVELTPLGEKLANLGF